jgi:hypothetical protein
MLMFRRGLTKRGVAVAAGVVLVLGVAAPVSAAAAPIGSASAGTSGASAQRAGKADKPKPPKPPKPKPKPGAGAPQVDISSTMPRTVRDEVTGDFLGRGYDQRMRIGPTSLNVYDSSSRGGGLLQATPTDLEIVPPGGVNAPGGICGYQDCPVYPWGQYGNESTGACPGCFQNFWNVYNFNTIYLARDNNFLFMAGTQGTSLVPGDPDPYSNWLYVLPPDGSCASATCAEAVIALPNAYNDGCSSPCGDSHPVQVTSLAATNVGGNELLAVGLNYYGVEIFSNADGFWSPEPAGTFLGMSTDDGSQTPVTALAWDPSGSGLLAIGVISKINEFYIVQVNGSGSVQPNWLIWSLQGLDRLEPIPLSAAFGQRQNGSPVVAVGMDTGAAGTGNSLILLDPKAKGPAIDELAASPQPVGAIVAVNPIPRFDGTAGGSDFAVSYWNDATSGLGGLLRWDGTSNPMAFLPVIPDPSNTDALAPSWDAFREWYPGIKDGRFQVSNTSSEPITVELQASQNPGFGCWYAPSWADAPAFPAAGVTVAAGQTSATYTMGAYTAGPNGACAATDVTGTWRGYLVITPVNHPADARLVGLRLNRDMTVDVDDQAGGASTSVSITQTGQRAAFGLWTITVATPAASTPTAQPPTVTAARVTPADFSGGPAVYRFDVTGATYQLPTPYPNQLVVEPLIVQGSVNGASWTTLGSLIPRTEPTIVNAANGSQLNLGPATFWWENPPGQPAYQQIRVALGPAGTPTAPVMLSSLPAPPDPTNVSGAVIAATSSSGNAAPVDSGVDLAPLSVQVLDKNSNPLPDTDPSYQRIYYRDGFKNLITNLLLTGASPNSFLGVTPYEGGAYPNNGSVSSGQPGTFDGFHYVSTTSTINQSVTGYIADVTDTSPTITVLASQISPANSATSAASGITLGNCADFANAGCRLYPITASQPALYLDTANGVQIGLLTAAVATTSTQILPLQQTAGTVDHLLASSTLNQTTNPNAPTLTDTSAFLSSDTIDTTLATHGQLHTVIDLPVGTN